MGIKRWGVLAICLGLWAANGAMAADWSVVPSITQRSEFDSNLNMSYTKPVSDCILSLQPAVDFNYTTEISQLQGRLGLYGQHYITNSNIDHIDQNYQINGRYQVLPRVNLALNTSYIVDTTLAQELLTSGLVMSRTPRQSFVIGPGATYNLTERLLGTISYNFNRVLYQAPQYTDYTNHQAGLNFTYLLRNEKTSLISNNIVRESLYAGGNNFKSLGIYAGVSHKFTERWDGSVMSGANISFYSFNTQVVGSFQFPNFITIKTKRVESSGVTPYVSIATSYRWTNLSISGSFSQDQNPSGYGAIYQVNRLSLALGYKITERLTGNLSASYSLSNQSSQNISSEYNYYNINPQLTYQITEKLSVSSGYNFQNAASLTATGGSAHNHVAWVQFAYSYPIHYQR
jgi:hypothetical protein